MTVLTNAQKTGKPRMTHDWKQNSQTSGGLSTSGKKETMRYPGKDGTTKAEDPKKSAGLLLNV